MKNPTVYNIIEVANTHGGSKDYVLGLLEEFSEFQGGFGIKFQPFKYDELAAPDYEWYATYKRLFFSREDWKEMIRHAFSTKDVWLDVSTEYSCLVLEDNLDRISGIKLQSSMLSSRHLLGRLEGMDTGEISAVVSVAGLSLREIEGHLQKVTGRCRFREIILQTGFQSYPTKFADSGLSKISVLREAFPHPISFADHLAPETEDSTWLPVVASLMGASVIEKHVRHSTLPAEFDTYSSMKVGQFRAYIARQQRYQALAVEPFLNEREREYLAKTQMVPYVARTLDRGQLVSTQDVDFRRSSKAGISISELERLQNSKHLLATQKCAGEPFYYSNFRKATIGMIIACRLKSTRLPNKALLELREGYTSIEVCQENCLKVENVNFTVLATSDKEEDARLAEKVCDGVRFHTGDPDDVIDRYLAVVNKLDIDIVLRFTGDCPYPSNEIIQILLDSHFASGADYTEAVDSPLGTAPQIINASALRKVKELFPVTDYSEYMNGYLINNPDNFKLNYVVLPKELVRDYRLTLDYAEDLSVMRAIEAHFEETGTPSSFSNVLKFLDENPSVAAINSGLSVVYKQDPELRRRIQEATTYKSSSR